MFHKRIVYNFIDLMGDIGGVHRPVLRDERCVVAAALINDGTVHRAAGGRVALLDQAQIVITGLVDIRIVGGRATRSALIHADLVARTKLKRVGNV